MSAQPEGSSADEVNAAELARVLGVTEARIRQLAGAGVIPRRRHGVYPLREAVQGYLASKLESLAKAQGSSSADRLRDERAKEIAQRTALRERVLIHIHEATAALDEIVGAYLESVSGLRCSEHASTMRRKPIWSPSPAAVTSTISPDSMMSCGLAVRPMPRCASHHPSDPGQVSRWLEILVPGCGTKG